MILVDGKNINFKKDIEIELSLYKDKINLRFDLDSNNGSSFNYELVKQYIDEINAMYPNNNFKITVTYIKDSEYVLNTQECKELEMIDNYLREQKYDQLYISQRNDINQYGFRQTLSANRKIDSIAEKIKTATINGNPLSTFEKFMIAYEYVTEYVYNDKEDPLHDKSTHWVPVIEGDSIICSGYASLLKALCDRIFSPDEVKVVEQCLNIADKKDDNYILGGHANNLIFIKDEKYGIDGLFYVDACWDSKGENDNSKPQAYCCIPLNDILNNKDFSFGFDVESIIACMYFSENDEYMNLVEELEDADEWDIIDVNLYNNNGSVEDYVEHCLFNNSHNQQIAQYLKEHVPGLIEYDINNGDNSENKISNARAVLNFLYKKANGKVVPIEAFINSYKIIGKMKGLSNEEIEEYVKNRLKESIKKTRECFDINNCNSCFAKIKKRDLEKENNRSK